MVHAALCMCEGALDDSTSDSKHVSSLRRMGTPFSPPNVHVCVCVGRGVG